MYVYVLLKSETLEPSPNVFKKYIKLCGYFVLIAVLKGLSYMSVNKVYIVTVYLYIVKH